MEGKLGKSIERPIDVAVRKKKKIDDPSSQTTRRSENTHKNYHVGRSTHTGNLKESSGDRSQTIRIDKAPEQSHNRMKP